MVMENIGLVYGILVGLVMLLALGSHEHVHQKLSILFLGAWMTTNLAVDLMGFSHAPLLIPSIDAVVAIMVAAIGYANRSTIALAVFLLYVIVSGVHVGAFILHVQETYAYYATLNTIFLAQLLVVGGSSAWLAIRRRPDRRRQRVRPYPARR
jgi:hypothetical protein